jgi:hypothetical protein
MHHAEIILIKKEKIYLAVKNSKIGEKIFLWEKLFQ